MKEKKSNKKLIEVSIPLDSINRSCTKENILCKVIHKLSTHFLRVDH